ncbi:hypothetical protein BCON_0438g00070 [Botryotinia convoluta]|uniref:Uncharacterized protein n=1 Tax=Botryotinia convoluta TaxID=54673 RepID=A0A4Z1HC00_9HELO|nr:hypothetical protein BCON_0438g00070 [Botryotinia convoluta]
MIAVGLSTFGEGLNYGQSLRTNSNNAISSVDYSPSDYHQFSIPEQTFTNQIISDPRFEAVEVMWDLPVDHPLQFPTRRLSTTTPRIGIQQTSIAQDTPSVRSTETISDSIPGSSTNSNHFVHMQPIPLLPMRDHEQVFVGSDRGHVEGAPGLDSKQKTDVATEYSESHIVNSNYYSEDLISGQY